MKILFFFKRFALRETNHANTNCVGTTNQGLECTLGCESSHVANETHAQGWDNMCGQNSVI